MAGANVGVSIPIFVLGLLLVFVFANLLKDTPFALPPSGRLTPGVAIVPLAERWGLEDQEGPLRTFVDFVSNMYTLNGLLSAQWDIFTDAFRHLILPAIALATIPLAIIARITRSSLLDVLGLDYVRTARAKGVAEGHVLRRHALRNATLPIVTIIGLQIGALLSGAVLTETIFLLPGVGSATVDAIQSHDFAVIQGFVLIIAREFPGDEPARRCQLRLSRPASPAFLMQSTAGAAEFDSQVAGARRGGLMAGHLPGSPPTAQRPRRLYHPRAARRIYSVRPPLDRIRPQQGAIRRGCPSGCRRRVSISWAARPTRRSTISGSTRTVATSSAALLTARASRCRLASSPSGSRSSLGRSSG